MHGAAAWQSALLVMERFGACLEPGVRIELVEQPHAHGHEQGDDEDCRQVLLHAATVFLPFEPLQGRYHAKAPGTTRSWARLELDHPGTATRMT
jgi:hypothetical protein